MKYFWKRKIYLFLLLFSFITIGMTAYLDSIRPFDMIVVNIHDKVSLKDFFAGFKGDAAFAKNQNITAEKLGKYDVKIKLFGRTYHTKVKVVDNQKPIVVLKNVKLGMREKITPQLFIEKIVEDSPYQVAFVEEPKLKSGEQKVQIKVTDSSLNETIEEATLEIGKVMDTYTLEAGTKLEMNTVLFDPKEFKKKKVIQKVDSKKLGEQDYVLELDGKQYTVKVTVVDTKKPVVKTKNVTIYWDEKVSINDFLLKVTDGTSVEKEFVTEIDYSKIGTQKVKIRVTDEADHVTEVSAKLTIKKDTVGPVISHLSTIEITRGEKINYTKGVTAYDDHDGKVKVTYQKNTVNTKEPGTYHVLYQAKDKSGNVTKKERTIIILGNSSDVKEKLKPIAETLRRSTKHDTAQAVRDWVHDHISYASSDSRNLYEAAWKGITTRKGDCYTHYAISKILLDLLGISNQSIYAKDKSHYWNLVYVEEGWRHLDSTPGNNAPTLMTDKEYSKLQKWDQKKWPSAK